MDTAPPQKRRFSWTSLIGPVLLVVLLWQLDMKNLLQVVHQADWRLLLLALLLNLPMVLLKSVRWQVLMVPQRIRYTTGAAYLAYFGSIFIGLLTPGRLGEFVKALHVSQDCRVSLGHAFASVLVDRLLDLYVLLLAGSLALFSLTSWHSNESIAGLGLLVGLSVVPLAGFLHNGSFGIIQGAGLRFGRFGRRLFAPESWLMQMRQGMKQLSLPWLLAGLILTVLANAMLFFQCYLLGRALGLDITFIDTTCAVALGSLITLVPISISGLGTREATIIAYLGTVGIPPELALGFSLLVFLVFYVGGGLMGAIAWWIKPVSLDALRTVQAHE